MTGPAARPEDVALSVVTAVAPGTAQLPRSFADLVSKVSARPGTELVLVLDRAGAAGIEFGRLGSPVRVLRNPGSPFGRRGAYVAGASEARGRVLLLLALEAELASGCLDAVLACFDDDPGIGIVEPLATDPATAPGDADGGGELALALRDLAVETLGGWHVLGLEDPRARHTTAPCRRLVGEAHLAGIGAGGWRRARVAMLASRPTATVAQWSRDPDATSPTGPRLWRPTPVAAVPRAGLNVVGLLDAVCGVGDASRRYVEAVAASGSPYATFAYQGHGSPRMHFEHHGGEEVSYDTNLLVLNADLLPGLAVAAGGELWADRYTIGLPFWELEAVPPQVRESFQLVNELWVSSEFTRSAFARHTDKPLVKVPLPVRRRDGAPPRRRGDLGLPAAFTFLATFDFGSVAARKNGLGVVRAFSAAFSPGEGPVLVLKTLNAAWDPRAWHELQAAIAGRRDVAVLDGYLADDDMSAMIANADCYVSLHRAEGFGLTLAEAMAWGRPVVGTAYSGNLDFMTDENSYLVPYDLGCVPAGLSPVYRQGAVWADPRIDEAARMLRQVWEHPREAAARGEVGRRDIRRTHSTQAVAETIASRLELIRQSRRRHAPPRPARAPALSRTGARGAQPRSLR